MIDWDSMNMTEGFITVSTSKWDALLKTTRMTFHYIIHSPSLFVTLELMILVKR